MSYRLYYSQYCYFCQKVLMALKGHQHDIELASTSDRQRQQELLSGGGKGQVPCLRIEDEQGTVRWMYESDDILTYIRQNQLLA